jgi:hypothetical protein
VRTVPKWEWAGPDLNRRSSPREGSSQGAAFGGDIQSCQDGVHCGESKSDNIDWVSFKTWVAKEYRPKTAHDRFSYAKQYSSCLLEKDLKPLLELSQDKRSHVMKALSSLSKFLGIYDQFMALIKNYGLKWSVRSDDLIIARFTKSVDPDEIFNWIKQVKASCPTFRDFMDLIATTGLRYEEAIESYNLIIKLSKENKLKQYYDNEREILEHFRFKDIFLRKTKKVFISFVPTELIQRISQAKPLSVGYVQNKVKRKIGKLRFGDIRELHGTLLTKHLSEVEINFLHGRVSSSVFMRNYFNPAWIKDLKERTFKAVANIMEAIS